MPCTGLVQYSTPGSELAHRFEYCLPRYGVRASPVSQEGAERWQVYDLAGEEGGARLFPPSTGESGCRVHKYAEPGARRFEAGTAVSNDVVAAHRNVRGHGKPAAGRKRKQSVTSRRASTSSVVSTLLDAFLAAGGRRSSVAGGLHNHGKPPPDR